MSPLEVIRNLTLTTSYLDMKTSISVLLGASPLLSCLSGGVSKEQTRQWKLMNVRLNLEQKYVALLELLVPVLVSGLGTHWFLPSLKSVDMRGHLSEWTGSL